ncbi:hypothetical protein FB45DRAFT_879119 [Roridomyces roridus]|uniref:Uncharacterized protein n=1 Tax=Roridomyces roridus TaxID=1738132 RepID=A0AAD7F8U7_9AGAR|nr:hypothetical protein FB45DRAFT_879119 [Roridomyces roridus]
MSTYSELDLQGESIFIYPEAETQAESQYHGNDPNLIKYISHLSDAFMDAVLPWTYNYLAQRQWETPPTWNWGCKSGDLLKGVNMVPMYLVDKEINACHLRVASYTTISLEIMASEMPLVYLPGKT